MSKKPKNGDLPTGFFAQELEAAAKAVRRWPKWKQEMMRKSVENISSGVKAKEKLNR